jgi:hypothetical protein
MDVYMYISVLLCWIREWNRFQNSVNDTWKSPFWQHLNTKYHVTSKYHHAPKQAWQTRVLIQCRYGLSGVRLFNLMVILFIFLIILNKWIYYTITFCRFTFCFYRLWQNKWIGGKGSSLMRHIYKRFFSKIEELRN